MPNEISTTVKLRPTRIAFLVRPSDRSSIRKIMRANSCLWGGTFNPIIPIFRNTPRVWREDRVFRRLTGKEIAKGYVKFFEPDAYVETVEGLLEEAGLGVLRGGRLESEYKQNKRYIHMKIKVPNISSHRRFNRDSEQTGQLPVPISEF